MSFWFASILLLAFADAAALRSSGHSGNKTVAKVVQGAIQDHRSNKTNEKVVQAAIQAHRGNRTIAKVVQGAIQAGVKVVQKDAQVQDASSGDATDAASAIQAQLTAVLSAGNAKLAQAEQEHEAVLTGVRNDASTDMFNRSEELGNALSQFAADRKTAQEKFNLTINATQKGLDLIAADLDINERATVAAKISMAQRQLKHVLRTEKSALESAFRNAEGPLDKESDSLMNMYVGDLSKPLADAKEKMQNLASAAPGAEKAAQAEIMAEDDDGLMDVLKGDGMAVVVTTTSTTTTTTTTAKKVVKKLAALVQELKPTAPALERTIELAMKTFDSESKAALKKVNGVIAKNTKDVFVWLQATKKKLDAASKAAADTVKLQ